MNQATIRLSTTQSRAAYLAQAQSGDAEAFGELVRPIEVRLFRQAMALCGDESLAEDLTQTTLIAAWKSIVRYNQTCQLFTWLYAIMLNCRKKQRRALWRFPASLFGWKDPRTEENSTRLDIEASDSPSPHENQLKRERGEMLRGIVDQLPEKNREVIRLRFYADTSLEEISSLLGCSLGTVKSRLFYGLEKLRKMNLKELQ